MTATAIKTSTQAITINFEQTGMISLPKADFACVIDIQEAMEKRLESVMNITTLVGEIESIDWLDRMALIFDKTENDIIFSIGGEASVTVIVDLEVTDHEAFGYDNLCLKFDDEELERGFNVKHTEIVA